MSALLWVAVALLVGFWIGVWDERHEYTRQRRWHHLLHLFGKHTMADHWLANCCYICGKRMVDDPSPSATRTPEAP